jgi:hypothetical protein
MLGLRMRQVNERQELAPIQAVDLIKEREKDGVLFREWRNLRRKLQRSQNRKSTTASPSQTT